MGQSDSSIRNKQNKIIEVHTFDASDYNGEVRLNALKIDYIKHWMGMPVAHHFGEFIQIDKKDIKLWSHIEFTMSKNSKSIKWEMRTKQGMSIIIQMGKNIFLYMIIKISGWVISILAQLQ